VQRILSVFAFTKYFGFSYALNPIKSVEIQPLDHINNGLTLKQEITTLNSWICKTFRVNTTADLNGYRKIQNPREFFMIVISIFLSGIFSHSPRREQLIFGDAYFLTKRKPKVWELVAPHSDVSKKKHGADDALVAHIHLRLSTFSSSGDRFIPIEYYKKIMDKLVTESKTKMRDIEFIIHTDFNSPITDRQFFLQNATPESLNYWVKLGMLKPNFEVDLEIIDAARIALNELLSLYSSARLFGDKAWTSEWESMANADWLVVSKSSYSLIGALLNQSGVVFAPKSWGQNIPHWVQLKV
jgi:hypothetical protein